MKIFKSTLTICSLVFYSVLFSQKDKNNYVSYHKPLILDELKYCTLEYYKNDIDSLNEKENKKFIRTRKEDDKWVFNNQMLAVFFNNEINSFAVTMKDLSLDPNIVSVNTDNKTLTVGRNINLQNNKNRPDKDLRKISNMLSVSATSSIDKSFSKIYSKNNKTNEYDFASEISLNFKFTHINNNIIGTYNKHRTQIEKFRNEKIEKYLQSEFEKDEELKDPSNVDIGKKYYEYYKKIADKEVKNIKDNTLFSSYKLSWWGVNVSVPLTKKVINVKSTKTVGNFDSKEFYSWKAELFFNGLYHIPGYLKGTTLNGRISGSVFNNNNFIANNTSAVTFQTIADQNSTQQILNPADLVFIGDYERFATTALKLEGASLFFNNTIGVSAALEKNFGTYDALNWKLGIPVSLKDKDKKPSLNFEMQWHEINKVHVLGISVGYIFGKFVR
ncbi:hypothetical protein [Chryseobacterium tongliaoense]|uniref:hypothetical protein n=1 Tax=Chryseobacterium tongliaoense TaxID=3240933 RepID=UPI003516CF7A